jgi:hypothetical protein
VERIKISEARCRALVISCSDFRFVAAQREARVALGLNNAYDLVARPGGVRSLVDPISEAANVTMHEEIRLLYGLHGFERILLMNHMNCGAYASITTPENEEALHREHLAAAKRILQDAYPGLTVEPYLSVIVDDSVEVVPVDQDAVRHMWDAMSERR